MRSKVFLLCSLLSRKRAKAKLNQMQTKLSFFSGGVRAVSTTWQRINHSDGGNISWYFDVVQQQGGSLTSRPKIIPATAPRLQKTRECHSSFTLEAENCVLGLLVHIIIFIRVTTTTTSCFYSRQVLVQSQNLLHILYETFIQKIVKAAADIPKKKVVLK